MKNFVLLLMLLILTGCGTLSARDCANADWGSIGYADGLHGEPANHVDRHLYSCRDVGVSVDKEAYEKGRQNGLLEYCTPEAVYRSGARGEPFQSVCSPETNASLSAKWAEGRHHLQLVSKKREAEQQLKDRQSEIANDRSVVGDIAKGFHILSGTSATQAEQDRVDRLDDELYKNERLAPPGSVPNAGDFDFQGYNPVSLIQHVFAFGVGATIGFGSGHAIEGHYLEDGWKWTAIDAAVFSSIFIVGHNCPAAKETETGQPVENQKPGCAALVLTSALAFIVSRIWEVSELIADMNRSADRYHQTAASPRLESVTIVPVADAYGVGAAFSF